MSGGPFALIDNAVLLLASLALAAVVGVLLARIGTKWPMLLMLAMAFVIAGIVAGQVLPALHAFSSSVIGVPAGLVLGGLIGNAIGGKRT